MEQAIGGGSAFMLFGLVFLGAGLATYPLGAALHRRLLSLHARGLLDGPPVARHRFFFERLTWLPYVMGRSPDNTPDRKALALARAIKALYLVMILAAGLGVWFDLGRPAFGPPPPPDRPAQTTSKPSGWFQSP